MALAWAVVQAFEAAPPPPGALPLAFDFAIDRRVLLFSVVLSFVTGILFGVAPALKASRPGLVSALKDASTPGDDRGARFELKKVLVVAEVALSLLLLIAAGLFVRSLQSARAIDPGFDAGKLVSAPLNVNCSATRVVQGREFYRQVVERVERVPGVESASLARVAVLGGRGRVQSSMWKAASGTHEQAMGEGGRVVTGDPTIINANVVGPRSSGRIGIPIVAGRDFDDARCRRRAAGGRRQRDDGEHAFSVARTRSASASASRDPTVRGVRSSVWFVTANTVRSPKVPRPWCSCLSRRITRRG